MSLDPTQMSGAQREELMDNIKQQIALANAQEMLKTMTEKCFRKCVVKPGTSLDSSEGKCLNYCMDRFLDSWNLVSSTYSARIQKERYRN